VRSEKISKGSMCLVCRNESGWGCESAAQFAAEAWLGLLARQCPFLEGFGPDRILSESRGVGELLGSWERGLIRQGKDLCRPK
jgi:hypothetical protein